MGKKKRKNKNKTNAGAVGSVTGIIEGITPAGSHVSEEVIDEILEETSHESATVSEPETVETSEDSETAAEPEKVETAQDSETAAEPEKVETAQDSESAPEPEKVEITQESETAAEMKTVQPPEKTEPEKPEKKKKSGKKKAPEIKPVKPIFSIANVVYTAAVFGVMTLGLLVLPRSEISDIEQRDLAEFPEFSLSGLMNGEYTNGITEYYNDTVPFRDELKKVAAKIRGLYGVSYDDAVIIGPVAVITEEPEEEPVQDITEPPQTTTAATSEPSSQAAETTSPVSETTTAAATTPPVTTTTAETTKNVNEIADGVITNGQVVTKLSDGHWWGMSLFGGGKGTTYANALNRFKAELGDSVNVWSMPAPTAGEFYLPATYDPYNASHAKSVGQINEQLVDVTPVDCISALWAHTDELIYLRTDHHWQPLGAYYAAQAFAQAAGLPFADISTMTRVDREGYMGTMYGFTEDPRLLADPETFTYYLPSNKYTTYYYDTAYNYTVQYDFFIPMPVSGSYSTFMGADNKIVRIKTDAGTGRKLVVFKDSYGNAEIPFWFGTFDEIYVCDMRYFELNGVEFVKFTGATDLLFSCCTFSAVGTNAKGLETILNNPVTTITEGAPG